MARWAASASSKKYGSSRSKKEAAKARHWGSAGSRAAVCAQTGEPNTKDATTPAPKRLRKRAKDTEENPNNFSGFLFKSRIHSYLYYD